MASILRSAKFVRYIAGFTRNVLVNTPRDFDANFVNNVQQCLYGSVSRPLATQASSSKQLDLNLEQSLKRIDQDVKKSGRISRRDIEDVLEEIRSTQTATSSQSLLVIRCCGNLVPEEPPEVRTKLVQEIWNTLNKLNVPMDISHYNALLRVYLENEHPFSPTEFLSELEAKGIEPNRVTYQRLISRYCQEGDIDGATKILEFMREKQLPVNENVFNALIDGHSQTGDMASAHGVLNVMAQAGMEPSANTYTTLLAGYAKEGNIETMDQLFDECNSKEIFLLDKDYMDIIYALVVNGHSQHIPQVLARVRKTLGYNQDAINLCLRLINRGFEDAAYLVLKSMQPSQQRADGTKVPSGMFFLRQMVKANRPVEKIIEICNALKQDGLFPDALTFATEVSLEFGSEAHAYRLLQEMKNNGLQVRQHYFWPLIMANANNDSGDEGIINVLSKMNEFDLTPSNETLRDYVIPNLKGSSSAIIAKLRDANVSIASTATCLVHNALVKRNIKEAVLLAASVNAYYRPELLRRPLTIALYSTNDVDSFVMMVRYIYENLDRRSVLFGEENEERNQTDDKPHIVGSFINDLAFYNNKKFLDIVESVLSRFVEEGLTISAKTAERIQDKLGEKMTDEISSLLGKLSSGELMLKPLPKVSPSYVPASQMNIPQLERLIHNLEAKKQDTKGLKRQLFTLYYRAKDLDKTESLMADLERTGFAFSTGMYAQLVDLYAFHQNLEKSVYYLQKLRELEPNVGLDDGKTISLAQAFIKSNKFEDAIQLLQEMPRDNRNEEKGFTYTSQVWRLLNSLAEEGRVEDLEVLFDTLIKKEYIEVNNVLLGPLIKVHLVNKDLDKAIEKFEWCVQQFQATPWKNELTCKLIETEDAEKLQRITDLSTEVHGEINSLYDLVFSFVECGRVRQARKILETPGLQSRPQRINFACERYQQEGKIKPLEDLRDATKDLNHIDRSDIYYQLLLSYIKQDEVDKALGLWTQMQEEDLQPTDQFLNTLGRFLNGKGVTAPFVVPERVAAVQEQQVARGSRQIEKPHTPQQLFRRKLKEGDIDKALELKAKAQSSLTTTDLSQLIERLVQQDRLNEAKKVVSELLEKGVTPINRVFKFYLNKVALTGDIDTLNAISPKITSEDKRLVSFDNRLCHAYLMAGKSEDYLALLMREIEEAQEGNVEHIAEKFPRGGAYGILERHPELVEKFEHLASIYDKKGVSGPYNVLWTYYFIQNQRDKAQEVWEQHLKASERIMFQKVVQTARDSKNEELVSDLITYLKKSNVTEGAIGNAYSCYLDILVTKDNDDVTLEVFDKAVKEVGIDHLNRTAVLRVKDIFEKLGKPFNHKVPNKTSKNVQQATSSTSSSSEEELKSKNK